MPAAETAKEAGASELPQRGRNDQAASVARQFKALEAVEFLMDHDQFWPGSKNDFAFEMGWLTRDGKSDRQLVEDVCTLTREQASNGLTEMLGGFVISYAPSKGGMVLWTDEEAPIDHYVHMFAGDMQREQQHRTENRRRLPYWEKAAEAASGSGDVELARLLFEARREIESTGFVSEQVSGQMMKVFYSRGLVANN
jgi:hypothetical protein